MRSPLVAGQWSITKVINVDAWAENAAAPFPTIDEMAMRSSGDGSPSLAAHTRNRIT